jgi:hypothetical protein
MKTDSRSIDTPEIATHGVLDACVHEGLLKCQGAEIQETMTADNQERSLHEANAVEADKESQD